MAPAIVSATMQAAALSTASNICAQFIEARQRKRQFVVHFLELLRFVALALMTAPPNFLWQQQLERWFPAYPDAAAQRARRADVDMKVMEEGSGADRRRWRPQTDARGQKLNMRNTLTKWFIDCITVGALLNTFAFLIIMGILKGETISLIWQNIRVETLPIIFASYKLWPIASIISFSFVPVNRRIVFLSFVGLVWGVYMSLVAASV